VVITNCLWISLYTFLPGVRSVVKECVATKFRYSLTRSYLSDQLACFIHGILNYFLSHAFFPSLSLPLSLPVSLPLSLSLSLSLSLCSSLSLSRSIFLLLSIPLYLYISLPLLSISLPLFISSSLSPPLSLSLPRSLSFSLRLFLSLIPPPNWYDCNNYECAEYLSMTLRLSRMM
jgi:hypothetical protein